MVKKQYLGDGVYVSYNGYQIELTTEDGENVDNIIYMEDSVIDAFFAFCVKNKIILEDKE